MLGALTNKFLIGQIVALQTDPDRHKRIVRQVNFSSLGVQYELAQGATLSWHYEFEIVELEESCQSIGFKYNG